MKIQAVLFDLDGTLLDTLADIGNSMNFVLKNMRLPTHTLSDYRGFVGEGVTVLARRALPPDRRDDDSVTACVERMREVYRDHRMDTTRPYEGIPELLDALDARGIRKAVLSNKPHDLTVALVAEVLGRWSFDPVFGERAGVARKPDPVAALEAAERLGTAPASILYLGDTPTDMATANAAGMLAVGAAWGFRSAQELTAAGASVVAGAPAEVLSRLDVDAPRPCGR